MRPPTFSLHTPYTTLFRSLGQFIEGMTNIEKVELLPYHRLGAHKWKTLGFDYELEDVLPPTKESLEHIKNILEGYGHTVKY